MKDSEQVSLNAFLAAVKAGLPTSWDWRQPVLVAVSGGADSMALLHGLLALARQGGAACSRQLNVVHVEYDLRSTAPRDRMFVVEQSASLGLPCHWRRLPLTEPGARLAGEGVEAAARRLRYAVLAELAGVLGARHVAVGHTFDDQAETILHRVLRGTGLTGLAGMPWARELAEGVCLVRPLLGLRREHLRSFLATQEHPWVEDESNLDTGFSRNFLRHAVLAAVEQGPYPAATEALVRLGEQATAHAAFRRVRVDQLIAAAVRDCPDGAVLLERAGLGQAGNDPHLVADVLLAIWRQQGWPRQELSRDHLQRLTAMLGLPSRGEANAPTAVDLPGGVRARQHPAGLHLRRVETPS